MSDFEDRLGRALGAGAEEAPGAAGLVDGARVLARRRRSRRIVLGAAVAVVAIAVPIAVVAAGSGRTERGADVPPAAAPDLPRVTCGGGASWDVEDMEGGLLGVVNDSEVRAAFADVLREAPLDAPTAIQEQGPRDATYIVLAGAGDSFTLGIGGWSVDGPARDATSAGLERQSDGSLRMTSWGDCRQLRVAVPPGRILTEVTAPAGGVDATTDAPVVLVTESDCTSGRDPGPFLGEPTVVEDDSKVVVVLTSEALTGGADCIGNTSAPLTLSLAEPIGDRELYDGGTFPPTPIELAGLPEASDGWRTVTYEGDPVNESGDNRVLVDLPPGWERLDTSGCGFEYPTRFGDPGVDLCGEGSSVSLFGSRTVAMCCPPGLDQEDTSTGYVNIGSLIVSVDAPDEETARRILASVRLPEEAAPGTVWRTEDLGSTVVEVPDDGSVDVLILLYTGGSDLDVAAVRRGPGSWQAQANVRKGTRVLITAPTQALADVVASTVRPAG